MPADETPPTANSDRPNRASRLTGVRREEVAPVLLMAGYGFLALTSYYVLKPVRNSVFLDRVGADSLPLIYILVAVIITGVAVVYSRLVDRWSREQLVQGTFGFLALGLLCFRWLLTFDSVVVSGAFFVWGKLYPLFLVSQFWLTGNFVFTQAQARRVFGMVGMGLILGGIAGGAFSGFAATTLGTENLVVASAIPLIGCALLVRILMARHAPPPDEGASASLGKLVEEVPKGAVRLLRDSSHLRNIAALLMVTILVSTLVDWQFNRAIELFVLGEDAMTEFFGRFFAAVNVASVLVQLLLTGLVLRRFGVGLAVLVLPLAIAVGTTGVFVLPVLVGAALVKGLEGTVRYSLDQSSREYLFLPVPYEDKVRAKPLIDLAVYRGGTGLGGVLLLLLVNVLGFTVRQVAVVTGVLIALWLLLALRTRVSFRSSVRELIGARDVELGELLAARLDETSMRELRRLVGTEVEESIFSGLPMTERAVPAEMADRRGPATDRPVGAAARLLSAALASPDERVRLAAGRVAEATGSDAEDREVVRLLADDDRAEDAKTVITHGGADSSARLAGLVADEELPPRARARLPRLLYEGATPETIERIVDSLADLPPALRYQGLKVLDRLRRNRGEELFGGVDAELEVRRELEEAREWALAAADLGPDGGLLGRTLDQRRWQALERLFRALVMEHGASDLHAAFRGIRSDDASSREYGRELLEVTVGYRRYRALAPLVADGADEAKRTEELRERTGRRPRNRSQLLRDLEKSVDPLVAVLAGMEAGREPDREVLAQLPRHLELRAFTSRVPSSLTDPEGIVDILERVERLGETDLFSELTTEDLAVLAALSDRRTVGAGDTVVARGEIPSHVYAVTEGRIEARRGEKLLFDAGPGEVVGQAGLLGGEPSDYDAVASRDSELLAIEYEDLFDLMRDRFTVVQGVLRYVGKVVRRLRPADEPPPDVADHEGGGGSTE